MQEQSSGKVSEVLQKGSERLQQLQLFRSGTSELFFDKMGQALEARVRVGTGAVSLREVFAAVGIQMEAASRVSTERRLAVPSWRTSQVSEQVFRVVPVNQVFRLV